MKVSIVIPVYNEAATVCELLDLVWGQPLPDGLGKELVIVESSSTDGSQEIVRRFVDDKRQERLVSVRLIVQPRPRGKGNAMREGFASATGDIILVQDSDLEYDVGDYPLLLQPILDGKTDFVLGSRHLGTGNWRIRSFESNPMVATIMNLGAFFFHGLFNLAFGQRLTDPTTMYKVFRRECLSNLHFVCDRFDFDFELLGKLIRAGHQPIEVPISYRSRGFKEGKKVRMFRDPPAWAWTILRARFGRL